MSMETHMKYPAAAADLAGRARVARPLGRVGRCITLT